MERFEPESSSAFFLPSDPQQKDNLEVIESNDDHGEAVDIHGFIITALKCMELCVTIEQMQFVQHPFCDVN